MNEKPITFNQEFIPKIEDGTKTQTRRPKKTDTPKYQKGDILRVKEAARIWLKVTAVRAERVQDISDEDLKKEGICLENPSVSIRSECVFFSEIWNSIYKKKGYGWDKNPYVFVYEFEKINKE